MSWPFINLELFTSEAASAVISLVAVLLLAYLVEVGRRASQMTREQRRRMFQPMLTVLGSHIVFVFLPLIGIINSGGIKGEWAVGMWIVMIVAVVIDAAMLALWSIVIR